MRSKYIVIGIVVGIVLSSVVVVLAGALDSPAAPGATSSFSLEDIYKRLDDGTAGAKSVFTEPAAGPGSTMHDLNAIMGKAPAVDNTNGTTTAQVLSGKTFWGLTSGEWGVQTGTATPGNTYNAGVPQTGQTMSYATGDDGDLEKGVAWPSPRFTDNGNGTVKDNLTGLIWLKDGDCMGTREWSDALTQVINLNAGTDFSCDSYTAGTHNDWRLPNVRELYSLIDSSQPTVAPWIALPSGHPFTGVQSYVYWSSTSYAYDTSYAWLVILNNGYVGSANKTTTYYVWPVRGG